MDLFVFITEFFEPKYSPINFVVVFFQRYLSSSFLYPTPMKYRGFLENKASAVEVLIFLDSGKIV